MIAQRSAHYWVWFLLFGLVSLIVRLTQGAGLDNETIWLLVGGLLGVVTGMSALRLGRAYDLVIGLLFTGVGLIGVLHNLGVNLVASSNSALSGSIDNSAILGISLALPYALIHTSLGLMSLNQGLRTRSAAVAAMPVAAASASE
ncbi:MAG TPA: hypothetical protein VGP82_24680 [Ktedonobacterales bacterium]|jgi:hypothetical protein|nr:hypothetical protein [Ktedonobacterales bacterium]